MEKLVFAENESMEAVPFTTSKVIADFSDNEHRAVRQLIRKYESDLEEFGILTFEMSKPQRGSKGGRPAKCYHLNKEQATLIITYLGNTTPVRQFKKELVRQFFAIESELYARRAERQTGKSIHASMTDAIRDSGLSPHFYKHYTDLAYKTALGFTAKQIRTARGIDKKVSPLNFLSADELVAVNEREQQIAMLIRLDVDYQAVKELVTRQGVIYQTTLQMPQKAAVEV